MAQKSSKTSTPVSRRKRRRKQLEYQRCEDRKLLAADLNFGPMEQAVASQEFSELAKQPDLSVHQQLLAGVDTAPLQKGLNGLVEIGSETNAGHTVTVLQQTWNGFPVFGSWLTTVQDETGQITDVRDQTLPSVSALADDTSPMSSESAISLATVGISKPTLMESTAHVGWYTAGDKVRLSWVVETEVSNPQGEVVENWETWVDVYDGHIFSKSIGNNAVDQLLKDPLTTVTPKPWVTINDAIGEQGSRDLAAPFNSVIQISVGCTGTLIAPDAFLSARHCGIGAGDMINFGVDSNNPDFSFEVATSLNPAGGNAASDAFDGGDVSIHTLVEEVPASVATPMRLTDLTDDLVGQVGMWIGYGANGLGSTGSGATSDGFRWAAENVIDAYGPAAPFGFGENMFTSDFDNGEEDNNSTGSVTPLVLEGMGGPGDSGGPMLVNINGEWVVGAVVSGGTTRTSEYGTIGWWTGLEPFKAEIEAVGGQFVVEEATAGFNRDEYLVGETITIRIFDPNAVGDLSITVTSDTGDVENVTASQSDEPGLYVATLESANANIVFDDGILQVDVGDQIEMTYVDADDGSGNPDTLTDTASFIAVTDSDLIGADFDLDGNTPANWVTISSGTDQTFSDLDNERNAITPVDLTVNGTYTALNVDIDPATVPLYPNALSNVDGQIQTSSQPLEIIYSDLVASTDYLVYVMAAEGIFDSIEQTVSIQGLGSPVVFEQRFNTGELFINDQVGDETRDLFEYAQLITADIDGEITIDITPIAGTDDVVLAGLAILPYDGGIDAISDFAITSEDTAVDINVTANDIETDGQEITLQSVSTPDNGTATITADGNIEYTPTSNFSGTDNFTYTITDPDGNIAVGAVTVSVSAINDAPLGIFLTPDSVDEDTSTANDVLIGQLIGIDSDDTSHTFQLVSGSGGIDNGSFRIAGDDLYLRAGTNLDFDAQSQFSIRVEVSDGQQKTETVVSVFVNEVSEAVEVSLNGGEDQRSMVNQAVIRFDEVVTVGAGAFEVIKRGSDGGAVGVIPSIDDSSGQTVVTLTFTGQFVTAGGSLEDGNYQLTILGDLITTSGGALDGDGDGNPGGNFVFGDTEADNFFRLFGDVDGDRVVAALDLLRFRQTYNKSTGDTGFDDRFDFNVDGTITAFDLLRFRNNYRDRLDFS